jgi:hypothetical protein
MFHWWSASSRPSDEREKGETVIAMTSTKVGEWAATSWLPPLLHRRPLLLPRLRLLRSNLLPNVAVFSVDPFSFLRCSSGTAFSACPVPEFSIAIPKRLFSATI